MSDESGDRMFSRPRLNPFAFPSETDSRFGLLIVSVLASTTFIYSWLAIRLPAYWPGLLGATQGCQAASAQASAELAKSARDPLADITAMLQATQRYSDCTAGFQLNVALWSLSGLPLLVALAIAFYWLMPRLIVRRRGLVELDKDDAEEVLAALVELSRQAGLRRPPVFLGAPGYRSTDALAFGRAGRRFVGLDQGLITEFYTQPDRFRAVVLHELAHLRNGDVDKAYLTVAVSLAFVVAGLAPLAVSMLNQPWDLRLGLGLRVTGLALLVGLTGAAVLRARESYADVRASTWEGVAPALGALLETHRTATRVWWQRLLRLHPDAAQRRAVLEDTRPLFRAALPEAFATGIAAAVGMRQIASIVSALATRASDPLIAPMWTAVILAPLLVGIVALGIWRATFAHLASGSRRPPFAQLAIALAAGLVVGQFLSLDAFFEDPVSLGVLGLLWGALVAAALYGFLRWVAAGAATWLSAAADAPSPRLVYFAGIGVATLVLIELLAALLLVNSTALNFMTSDHANAIFVFTFGLAAAASLFLINTPLTALALIALWAYPLSAAYWRQPTGPSTGPGWVFLDPAPPVLDWHRSRADLLPAIRAGMIGGVVCGVALLMLYVQWHAQSETFKAASSAKIGFFESLVTVSVVVEAFVAAFVAWRAPALKITHALLAAFVSGCLAVGSLHGINLAYGGTIDFPFFVNSYVQIVCLGTLAGVATASVAAALASGRTRTPTVPAWTPSLEAPRSP